MPFTISDPKSLLVNSEDSICVSPCCVLTDLELDKILRGSTRASSSSRESF